MCAGDPKQSTRDGINRLGLPPPPSTPLTVVLLESLIRGLLALLALERVALRVLGEAAAEASASHSALLAGLAKLTRLRTLVSAVCEYSRQSACVELSPAETAWERAVSPKSPRTHAVVLSRHCGCADGKVQGLGAVAVDAVLERNGKSCRRNGRMEGWSNQPRLSRNPLRQLPATP